MKIHKRHLFRIVPLVLLIISCAGQSILFREDPVPEHINFIREKIVRFTAEEDQKHLFQASLMISRETTRRRLSFSEGRDFMRGVLLKFEAMIRADTHSPYEQLPAEPTADLPAEPHSGKLRNFNILLAHARYLFGQDSFPDFTSYTVRTEGEDILAAAEKERLEGYDALALHYLFQAVEILGSSWFLDNAFPLETALWYAAVARKYHNRDVLSLIVKTIERNYPLEEKNAAMLDAYREYAQSDWDVSVGVEASVTIWVDKGIRLEGSVGFPDRSIGTGFYVASDGYIITNYHVIASEVDPTYEGKSELFIRPGNNPQLRIPATVIAYDRIFDIALIKAESESPELMSFLPARSLPPGSNLFVVGSPGGLERSVTAGIVSAQGRRFLQMGDFVQVDVPINPGNSGGPMFDEDGHLVGVVFAGVEQFEGVNFAIPAYWIQYFFPQLFEGGEVRHPWFGMAARRTTGGLAVDYVVPGSPAEEAGFQAGEIVTAINGRPVSRIPDAQAILLGGMIEQLYDIAVEETQDVGGRSIRRLVYSEERPYSPLKNVLGDRLANVWLPPLFGMKVVSTRTQTNTYTITEVFSGGIADESGLSEHDHFRLLNWFIDPDLDIAVLQIFIQKRTNGYLDEGLQLAAYIELNSFL